MTLAVEASTFDQQTVPHTVPIVILGTDAVLAAQPASPVQLAHACLRAGFSNVLPASWGDELIAAAVLRRLPQFGTGPVIQCSCPIVAHRLLAVGGDLRPALLPLVSPPVAVARYVRELAHPAHTRITYVGNCPGAVDASIDIRMTPDALIAMLAEREIRPAEQPTVFESVIPADRRRFRSQPGGLPAAEALWTEIGSRTIAELEGDDLVSDIAQALLTGKNVLIDAAARLGCVCAGAVAGRSPHDARAAVSALEPPRATAPVVDENAYMDLDQPVPAVSRSPIDIVSVPPGPASPRPITPPRGSDVIVHRNSPPRGIMAQPEARPPRTSGPTSVRPVIATTPIAREPEVKTIPRAYVARRRPAPRKSISTPASEPASRRPPVHEPLRAEPTAPPAASAPPSVAEPTRKPTGDAKPAAPPLAAVIVAPELESLKTYSAPKTQAAPVDAAPLPHPSAARPSSAPVLEPQAIEQPAAPARPADTPTIGLRVVEDPPRDQREPDAPEPRATQPRQNEERELRITPNRGIPRAREPQLEEEELTAQERIIVTPPPVTLPVRHLLLILIAVVGIAVGVSTVVALMVGRSSAPTTTTTPLERDLLR